MKPPNPTPRRKTFIYSGISLKVSRCLLLCLPDEVAHNNGGGNSARGSAFVFAMEIVTRRNCRQICTTGHDPRCPERLARSLPRSRCRKRPGQADSNYQRVKSKIRRRKKEEGSSVPTEDRQEKGVKRVSFVSSGWTDGCPHSASRVLRHPARNPRKNA